MFIFVTSGSKKSYSPGMKGGEKRKVLYDFRMIVRIITYNHQIWGDCQ